MFFYVSVNLGSSGAGILKSIGRLLVLLGHGILYLVHLIPFPGVARGGRARSGSIGSLAGSTSNLGAYFRRQLLVDSKFLLGALSVLLVLTRILLTWGLSLRYQVSSES